MPGPALYHERVYVLRGPSGAAFVVSPDDDCYEESAVPDVDVAETVQLAGLGAAVPGGARVYRFRTAPSAAVVWTAIQDAARAYGVAMPPSPAALPLAAGNPDGRAPGPLLLAAPAAIAAAIPPAGAGVAPPAAGAAAGLPPVVAGPPAGLPGLVAALGGLAPGAAAAPAAGAAAVPPMLAAPGGALAPPAPAAAAAAAVPAAAAGAGAVAAAPAVAPPQGAAAAVRDLRCQVIHVNAAGQRWRDFADGVALSSSTLWTDFPVRGPRSALWVGEHMRRHTNSPMAWHTKFLAEWGLSQDDPLSVEHALLCKILELAVCYDQVNLGELAHLELAARRLQLVEEKVMERALAASANKGKDKDKGKTSFDDRIESDLFLGAGESRGNICVCPALRQWIAEEMKAEAAVAKERRKAREERAART